MFDISEGWRRILKVLEQRELLPAGPLTPAELAHQVRAKTNDARVEQFVWQFYYPRVFGRHVWAGMDDEAETCVRAIEGPPRAVVRPIASVENAPVPTCPVCGRRSMKGRTKS